MIKDINQFTKLFFSATYLPISYYSNDHTLVCSYPLALRRLGLTENIFNDLLHLSQNPSYLTTKSHANYGMIHLKNQLGFLIIGPTFSTNLNREEVRSFMHDCTLPPGEEEKVLQYLKDTPTISFHQHLNTLTYLHYSINDEELNYKDHYGYSDENSYNTISTLHSNQVYDSKEEKNFHNTYEFEQRYLQYITQGEPEKLEQFFMNQNFFIKEGKIADNILRQSKNIFIAGTTLATRSAIAGGLDIEQAYQLSDIYIKECEKLQSEHALTNLNFTMNLDFAKRVAQNKIPKGMSKEIFDCMQFISRHTNESIRVDDVATFVGRSRSYISKKFKAELGFDLSSFIMRCKLEEAKSLLTYSNKSLIEISNYLCFSSQSYFQNVFKKKYGLTPMNYRNQTILYH